MQLAILLSKKPRYDHDEYEEIADVKPGASRLVEAAAERGHELVRLYESGVTIALHHSEQLGISYEQGSFPSADCILYRPGYVMEPTLHVFIPQALVRCGYRVLNSHPDVVMAKNKLLQHMRFAEIGIPSPRWAIAKHPDGALRAAQKIGFPVIIKVAFGTHGRGVFYAANEETFMPIAHYLSVRDGNPIIVEELIETPNHGDVRAFVVGGEIVAAMERIPRSHEIRANAALGGEGRSTRLSKDETALALKVSAAFHLDVAGIDMLRGKSGTVIIEVNANPGFRELEKCTGVDVAGKIIEYMVTAR